MSELLGPSEQNTDQELTREERRYLKMQTYYFFPFLRRYYQFLSKLDMDKDQFKMATLNDIKTILSYYGNAFMFGEFNINQEQHLITNLFSTIHQVIPQPTLEYALTLSHESYSFGSNAKEDGSIDDYLYGSTPCKDLFSQQLPGGPHYNMGITAGIIDLPLLARETIDPLTSYLSKNRGKAPLAIWGNVARGTIEAAAVHKSLERKGVPSSLHLFRASSHAYHDTQAFSIAEPKNQPTCWNVAVDTMSAGGSSVPQAFSFLQTLQSPRASLYLTFGGGRWVGTNRAEFRSPQLGDGKFGYGILLKA